MANHYILSIPTNTNGTGTFGGEFGAKFTVGGADLTLTALAAYLDHAAGTWSSSKVVNLWDNSTHSIVATATITNGDIAGGSVGQFVFKSVTPFTLVAGRTYFITASGYGTDKFYSEAAPPSTISGDYGSGSISLINTAGGTVGMGWLNNSAGAEPNSQGGAVYAVASLQYSAGVTVGQITATALDATGITLSCPAPAGGTAPYTYQWQSATGQTGSFSNVGGATSSTYKALSTGITHYQCVVTDNVGGTATAHGYADGRPFAVTPAASTLKVVLIGDSTWTTGQSFDQTTLSARLTEWFSPSAITLNNQAISGKTTATWLASDGSGSLNSVIAGLSAGVYQFCISLGTNDAKTANLVSAATWKANIQSICASLLAAFPGSTCWIFGPGYVADNSQWSDASRALLLGYCQAIDSTVNGSTIRKGSDTRDLYMTAENQALLTADLIHPSATGGTQRALTVAYGLRSGIIPADSTGSSSSGSGNVSFGGGYGGIG